MTSLNSTYFVLRGLLLRGFSLLLLCLLAHVLFAQQSDFEIDDELWRCSGDPISPTPQWLPTGGTPNGYIKGTDSSSGGTCYFEAPPKYLGNKADAYGGFISYDMFNDDTTDQALYPSRPDIILEGNGLRLVYDNFFNPGIFWMHYEVTIDEFTGWRVNSLGGPLATREQFCQVLSNLERLALRFEYRTLEESAGLDNVEFRSNFAFDLDADNSSGAIRSDFRADTVCTGRGPLADVDMVLRSEARVDSITVRIIGANALEIIELNPVQLNIIFRKTGKGRYTLVNAGNAALSDFIAAIKRLEYVDQSPKTARATRRIEYKVFLKCGEVVTAQAALPVYPPPSAGLPGDTLVCAGSDPFPLALALRGEPDGGGFWTPATSISGGFFDPKKDPAGRYTYTIPRAGKCPGDSSHVTVRIQGGFTLRSDTTLCYGDALWLQLPVPLDSWQWSDGSRKSTLNITEPGTYTLTGTREGCTFSDSVQVSFFTCTRCSFYAPNVFSPNDDGENDAWQLFIPCVWSDFELQIFDRWGSLVFQSHDPETRWNGVIGGRDASPGVYAWVARWIGEYLGKPLDYQAEGNVTVLR